MPFFLGSHVRGGKGGGGLLYLVFYGIYMYDLILTMNVIKTHNLLLTRLMTTDRLALLIIL